MMSAPTSLLTVLLVSTSLVARADGPTLSGLHLCRSDAERVVATSRMSPERPQEQYLVTLRLGDADNSTAATHATLVEIAPEQMTIIPIVGNHRRYRSVTPSVTDLQLAAYKSSFGGEFYRNAAAERLRMKGVDSDTIARLLGHVPHLSERFVRPNEERLWAAVKLLEE